MTLANDPVGPRILAPQRSWSVAALIAALAMLGPFSIDLYLPAFPAIGVALDAPPLGVQRTLSAYLFAYPAMMLWHGALSDALGRRPVALAGLAVSAVATLGCAIAGNIESLWLFRALQGVSAGTGLVVGRAIIRDRFHGPEAQRLMSQITLVFGIAPAIAPVLGGVRLNTMGWRSIFWVLLVMVVGVPLWAGKSLPETLPREARQMLNPRALWRNYRAILTKPEFLLLALIPAFNIAAFFLYVAVAPSFLIGPLGVTTNGFAWLLIPMIAGIMLGATMSGRLAGRGSPKRTVQYRYALMASGVAVNLAFAWFVPAGLPWNVLPIIIYTMGTSMVMPSVTLLLLDLFPTMREMATSLKGFVEFTLSAVNAGTIAPILAHSLTALALGMAGFTLASYALWLVYQRRSRGDLAKWKP